MMGGARVVNADQFSMAMMGGAVHPGLMDLYCPERADLS